MNDRPPPPEAPPVVHLVGTAVNVAHAASRLAEARRAILTMAPHAHEARLDVVLDDAPRPATDGGSRPDAREIRRALDWGPPGLAVSHSATPLDEGDCVSVSASIHAAWRGTSRMMRFHVVLETGRGALAPDPSDPTAAALAVVDVVAMILAAAAATIGGVPADRDPILAAIIRIAERGDGPTRPPNAAERAVVLSPTHLSGGRIHMAGAQATIPIEPRHGIPQAWSIDLTDMDSDGNPALASVISTRPAKAVHDLRGIDPLERLRLLAEHPESMP